MPRGGAAPPNEKRARDLRAAVQADSAMNSRRLTKGSLEWKRGCPSSGASGSIARPAAVSRALSASSPYTRNAGCAFQCGHYADAMFFLHEILSLKPDHAEAAEELRRIYAVLSDGPSTHATTLPSPPLGLH